MKKHRSFTPEVNQKLRAVVRTLKTQYGSEEDLALALGTSQASVSRWLTAVDPSIGTINALAICRAAGLRLADFVEEAPPPSGTKATPRVDAELEFALSFYPDKWSPAARKAARGLAEAGVELSRYQWIELLPKLEDAIAAVPIPPAEPPPK